MATRRKHTPEQVVRKLQDADRLLTQGTDVAGVCRELGVSEQTYYRGATNIAFTDNAPPPGTPDHASGD